MTSLTGGNNTPIITQNGNSGSGNAVGLSMGPYSGRTGGAAAQVVAVDDGAGAVYLSFRVASGSSGATASEQLTIHQSGSTFKSSLTVNGEVYNGKNCYFRVKGNGGLYWQSWGGGFTMVQSWSLQCNGSMLFASTNLGAPALGPTSTAGTRIVLWAGQGSNSVDSALGMDGGTFGSSIPSNACNNYFKWYGGGAPVMTLDETLQQNIQANAPAGSSVTAGTGLILSGGDANCSGTLTTSAVSSIAGTITGLLTVGSNATTGTDRTYGSGTYVFSDSTTGTSSNALRHWDDANTQYNEPPPAFATRYSNSGYPAGSTSTTTTSGKIFGGWCQITFPLAIKPTSYYRTNASIGWYATIVASNDASTWVVVASNIAAPSGSSLTYAITPSTAYLRWRLILTQVNAGDNAGTVYFYGNGFNVATTATYDTVINAKGSVTITDSITKGSGSSLIKHLDPAKRAKKMVLRHCFVESPTRGDNIYRFTVSTDKGRGTVHLPDYFPHLNEDL
ncbi:hypothetical protein HDV00_008594 [Rhizophlyctis rosea]|nr:hypothetical protein HDV00_008594 [Rhizophlyctis rosea]